MWRCQKPLDDKRLFKRLGKLSYLETLEANNSNLDDADLESLVNCTTLKKLTISDTSVTGAGLAFVAKLPQLINLGLDGLPIQDDSVAALDSLTGLKRLYLGGTQVTDRGIASLASLTGLIGLGLEGTRVHG